MTVCFKNEQYHEALEHLLQICQKRVFPARTCLFRPGDKDDKLYFVIEGSVSVSTEDTETRQELILDHLNKQEFIGEIGVFHSAKEIRQVTIRTRCECILAEIGYEKFRLALKHELLAYAPDLLFLLGCQLSTRLLLASRKFTDLAFMDVEGRIARILLDLCKEPDAITHPDGMQLHISRQEISRMVGCSREMAGRVIKELENKKLLTAHGKTIVVFVGR